MFIQYWGDSAPCPSKSWQNHVSSFLFCSSLRTAAVPAEVSPDKEVMQASASTAEVRCLGTLCPLPRGRIACENNPLTCINVHGRLMNSGSWRTHELRAQVCFGIEWPKEVWFAISLCLKREQSPGFVNVCDRQNHTAASPSLENL